MKNILQNRNPLKSLFSLSVIVFVVCGATAQTQWVQKGDNINGEADNDNSGWALDISADGSIVAIGARGNEGSGLDIAGHVRVYQYASDAWVQLGEDIDGEADGDESGVAVSLSSDGLTVAIGAYSNGGSAPYAGHVRVFHFNGTAWVQVGGDIDGEADGDRSGFSVSISSNGEIVAIGAPYYSGYRGQVRVYALSEGDWLQLGSDIIGEGSVDICGNAVSLSSDGTILAVGAMWNDGNGTDSGHTRVYQFSGTEWVQLGADIDGEAEPDNSGYSVSLNADGTSIAIGENANHGEGTYRGQARVFEYVTDSWIQKGQDLVGDKDYCQFGNSVSISSDGLTLAVGSSYYNGAFFGVGQVKIFNFEESSWGQTGSSIEGEAEGDHAGLWVSLNSDGTSVAFGAPDNSGGGMYRGNVRVFSSCTQNSGIDVQSACESYVWIDGNTYAESNNTATYTLTNAAGCDSIVTLNLTVNTIDVSVVVSGATLTSNANGALYQWVDCDNAFAAIPGETSQSFSATTNGNYAVIVTQGQCIDTSACTQITSLGIGPLQTRAISIYPNPVSSELIIEIEGNNSKSNYEILNAIGQVVLKGYFVEKTAVQTSDFVPGVYLIKLENGNSLEYRKIIKR